MRLLLDLNSGFVRCGNERQASSFRRFLAVYRLLKGEQNLVESIAFLKRSVFDQGPRRFLDRAYGAELAGTFQREGDALVPIFAQRVASRFQFGRLIAPISSFGEVAV